jgi:hypothetical protein
LSSSIFIDVENKDKSTRKCKEDKLKKKEWVKNKRGWEAVECKRKSINLSKTENTSKRKEFAVF